MVSYFKTQWFNLAMALGALILVIINLVQGDNLMVVAWTVSFCYWMLNSYIGYNSERIRLLEADKKRNDAMYDLVQELLEANKIDREQAKQFEARLKKLEGKQNEKVS